MSTCWQAPQGAAAWRPRGCCLHRGQYLWGWGSGQGQSAQRAPAPTCRPSWPHQLPPVPPPAEVEALVQRKWPARAASASRPRVLSAPSLFEATSARTPCRRRCCARPGPGCSPAPSSSGTSLETGKEGSHAAVRAASPIHARASPPDGLRHLCPLAAALARCINSVDEELGSVGTQGFTWVLVPGHSS